MLELSDISAVLKEVVAPEVYDQLSNINLLFQKVKSDSSIVDTNNNIYIPVRTGRHSGVYSVAEGVNPRTGKAKRQRMSSAIKYTFGTLELTDQALTAAKRGDKKAVVPILTDEITALTSSMEKAFNRQWFGDGTGQLCLANGAGSSATTVVVDTPGTDYIVEGMYVVIGSNSAVEVVSVDSDTQFTIASALTWNDNDVIKAADADEMMGLKGIIDDGTYVATFQGLSRASNPFLNAYCDDTAATLTEAQMITAYNKAKKYASKGDKIVCFMGQTLFEKYGSLLTSLKRTADLKEVLSGGWKGLEFMGGECPVILDYDTPEGFVFFANLSVLLRAEMEKPFQWLEGEKGGILTRSPSNRTVWEATMKAYMNLVTTFPRAASRLSGKTA